MKDNNLQIGITAALEAGERIMEIYATDNFDIDFKSDNTPLTKADLAANDIILDRLKSTGIPILSEEGKSIPFEERRAWKHLWIVDPIDGTKEFIKRNGEFTVNIALIENQVPIAGVVLVPALKELYFSSIELGAFKTKDLRPNLTVEERVESAKRLPESKNERGYTVVASRSHLSEETVAFITDLEEKHEIVCQRRARQAIFPRAATRPQLTYPRVFVSAEHIVQRPRLEAALVAIRLGIRARDAGRFQHGRHFFGEGEFLVAFHADMKIVHA